MLNKYYDSWEFRQAHAQRMIDPYEAIAKFEEYIKKYPEDYSAYIYYASSLVTVGRLKEAKEILDNVESTVKQNRRFSNKEKDKIRGINHDLLFVRLRIMSYEGKYEELYEVLKTNQELVKRLKLSDLSFYCRKKLGLLDTDRREGNSYLFRQIVDYKESDFLEHIKKHLADYNKDLDEPNKNVFVPDFPILKVIEEIKKYIPSDKKMCSGFWEDVYVFKYDSCGRDNNRMVNYFRVVCMHNSRDFITICPVAGCENFPCIDLNYMVDDDRDSKIKRVSKIEKFNKKYGRN